MLTAHGGRWTHVRAFLDANCELPDDLLCRVSETGFDTRTTYDKPRRRMTFEKVLEGFAPIDRVYDKPPVRAERLPSEVEFEKDGGPCTDAVLNEEVDRCNRIKDPRQLTTT